eukprot:TRINITY_DN15619_c0_g1_i1.p1 TRINITY_DN15619_c0_g1~~TRINITY_DN15619_c0_g1_i1.p1  ORF type:complete len:104 (-),score=25.82 TRINITY_DN15619_c0_g1_i1:72-383(-)
MVDESFSSSSESVDSVIFRTSEHPMCNDKDKNFIEEETGSETNSYYEDVEENVIKASCTLENNSPVIITTNHSPSKCLEFVSTEQDVKIEQHDVMRETEESKK